jgi:hypothetical protein
MNEKQPIPFWRWILWWLLLCVGIVAFYILMTPFWLAVRAAAWAASRSSRLGRRRSLA